ncbi:NHL repeat protein [compost metagenome]
MSRHAYPLRLLGFASVAARGLVALGLSMAAHAGELPVPPEEAKYPNILKPIYQIGSYGRLPGQMNNVIGVAYTSQGQVVIADTLNHRVQILERNGRPVMTFGGLGSGVGQLNSPQGVAVSADGEIFVSDTGNNRIQVFSSEGKSLRIFGSFGAEPGQFNEPNGISVHGSSLFVADTNNGRVQVLNLQGRPLKSLGSAEPRGMLTRPIDVAVSPDGQLFVVDHDQSAIFKYGSDLKLLQVWGSWGSYGGMLANPSGISVSKGQVFVADQINHRIQVFSEDGELLYQFGRHPIQNHEGYGRLHYVERIAVNSDASELTACEPFENRCQIFALSGISKVVAVNDSAWWDKATKFHYGKRAAAEGALLAISEPDTHAVLAFEITPDQGPKLIGKIGQQGKKPGEFRRPSGIAIRDGKSIYVSDSGNRRLQQFELQTLGAGADKAYVSNASKLVRLIDFGASEKLDEQGNKSTTAALNVMEPSAVRFSPDKKRLYLVDPPSAKLIVLDENFNKIGGWGSYGIGDGQFRTPIDVALSPQGDRVYVVDHYNYRIQAFDANGKFLFAWGGPGPETGKFVLPFGIAVHPKTGDVYVSDTGAHRLQQFKSDGTFIRQWGRWGVAGGEFYKPKGIAIGDDGRIYVTDFGNHRGQIFSDSGNFISEFGLAEGNK